MSDYEKAVELGLTNKNRWERGLAHHRQSERLLTFIAEHDMKDYGDGFDWKRGGDGDNGETLMYETDAFFETLDATGPTDDELRDTLIRYEGCVSRVERDGDDSDEAVNELAEAREALMGVLKAARDKING